MGGVVIESNYHKNHIRARTRYDINALLEDGYEVDYDRIPVSKKKRALEQILTGKSIKMFVIIMIYTIGGKQAVNKIH